jgi:hypothetical protein
MKSVYISDELHRRAKLKAAEAGVPLKELIEQWIDQGLRVSRLPKPELPATVQESATLYDVQAVSTAPGVSPTHAAFMDEMERRGLLVGGERLREQFRANYLAARKAPGITTPPPVEPPSVEEVRAFFRQQRELFPEMPTVTELLIQMREEE